MGVQPYEKCRGRCRVGVAGVKIVTEEPRMQGCQVVKGAAGLGKSGTGGRSSVLARDVGKKMVMTSERRRC